MIEIEILSKGFNSTQDVTDHVNHAIYKLDKNEGVAKVCATGSTIGLIVMRYEPGTVEDLLDCLEIVTATQKEYAHYRTTTDSNGFAHVRSSLLGTNVMVPYKEGSSLLSDKHRIILFDFDPKISVRKIYVDY